MGLSRSRSTINMRTTTSPIDEVAGAPFAAVGERALPSRRGARSRFPSGIVGREFGGPQMVDIWVDRGYQPAQSVASADEPLRLVFHRRDADHCTERVVFSSPHIERRLAANGTTIVDLPAQPPGLVRFTCGMGRYRGEIALVPRRAALDPRQLLGRSRRLLAGGLAAGAAVTGLLAALGTLQVDVAAGMGVLLTGSAAALLAAPQLFMSLLSDQS